MGHAISAGDPRLARINVSVVGFLAREDPPPIKLPFHRSPREVATSREETALLGSKDLGFMYLES